LRRRREHLCLSTAAHLCLSTSRAHTHIVRACLRLSRMEGDVYNIYKGTTSLRLTRTCSSETSEGRTGGPTEDRPLHQAERHHCGARCPTVRSARAAVGGSVTVVSGPPVRANEKMAFNLASAVEGLSYIGCGFFFSVAAGLKKEHVGRAGFLPSRTSL
jgi:hypothetical protein